MNARRLSPFIFVCLALVLSSIPVRASAEDFTNAVAAYLQHYVHAQLPHGCIVIGLVDERGSRVVGCGDLGNGTDRQADGDTLFNLQSATYAFSCLLLQDMVDRGEMQPDDPAAKYLPASVNLPTWHGQQITLRHLAKELSGLRPSILAAVDPKRADFPLAGFTAEKLYALVSNYRLTSPPGTTHLHPSVDHPLLDQIMALKTGMDIEPLLTARIFGPLHMNDTRLTLTREMESRLAPEHDQLGYAMPRWHGEDFPPMGALYSDANDLLKFLSACGITSSALRSLWDNTAANFAFAPPRAGMLHTGGGWFCNGCFIAFDKARRRGVVVLANSYQPRRDLGILLLDSEWQSDRRPSPADIGSRSYASYTGQYQRSADVALGLFVIRHYLLDAPKISTLLPAVVCVMVLAVLLWRAGSPRKRRRILGWTILGCAVLAPLLPLASSRILCALLRPGIGIHCEGARLFAQPTGSDLCTIEDWPGARAWQRNVHPIDILFPPVPVELLPESEPRFFERLSGVPMTFSRDARGNVTSLALHYRSKVFRYDRISDVPPGVPEPVKPPVIVQLDTNRLDACVGRYEVAPGAVFPKGMNLTVWGEGGQLVARARGAGEHFLPGAFDLFPESETNFFDKFTGGQYGFIKNDQGQVAAVTYHIPVAGILWFPDWEATKLKSGSR
ncbi:MAG TPA: serine hydrolase [Verrucomicrobiae bacterium]|nr:serine hydrolase [Verrucomicrobiae bacterium]